MAMMKDFADAATCPLGDFACALRGTHTDILSGDARAFADVSDGINGVKCHEIARPFADTLGCRSSSLAGALADVPGSAANITARTAWLCRWRRLSLGRGLRWDGWVLVVLGENALTADSEG
jgi:hypothetical protein